MNPNQTVQNLKRKFSLIAQKNSVPYTNENGEFDETWMEKFGGNKIKVITTQTDIDTLKTAGEYWLLNATCNSGWPSDLPMTTDGNMEPINSIRAYVKVLNTETDASYPTIKITQQVYFYGVRSYSGTTSFIDAYIRFMGTAEGYNNEFWSNVKINKKTTVSTSYIGSAPPSGYIPAKLYPNTDYFIGNFIKPSNTNPNTIYPLYDLTLTDLPDSPYPIGIYFTTGASFSGITASQIKAWIGNTTLNPDSAYKITIANLIGTIEELTIPQQI